MHAPKEETGSVATITSLAEFCSVCDDIKMTPDIVGKSTHLNGFMQSLRERAKVFSTDEAKSLFPIVRLFLPQYERKRKPFRIHEHTFRKMLITNLCLTTEEINQLKKFKETEISKYSEFSDVAYSLLSKRFASPSSITIEQLNQALDKVSQFAGNDKRSQENVIFDIMQKMSPLEQKWVIKIILKDLKLGLGYNKILTSIHWTAPKLFSGINNLEKVCTILLTDKEVNDCDIHLFTCFRPMLSTRCCKTVCNKIFLKNYVYFIETKYDGERFQIHYKDKVFKLFSRNGFDFTDNFTELTDAFPPLFNRHVQSFIMDGEMMLWHKEDLKFGSKGNNKDVKKLGANSVYQACFVSFDLLYLNGNTIMHKPLCDRKILLENVMRDKEGIYINSKYTVAKKNTDVVEALNEAINNNEEGIVFKTHTSAYYPNERKGWWKMKPEYFDGIISDLDLVVMGGYYGTKEFCELITNFVVGVIEGQTNKVLAFCRLASGLSKTEIIELNQKLGPSFNEDFDDPEINNSNLMFGRLKPDVWIDPEMSCVMVVKGSELIRVDSSNPYYKTEYTLRFPRILTVRYDKSYADCATVDDLKRLTQSYVPVVKLNKRHLNLSDLSQPFRKTARVAPPTKSELLQGYEFLIQNGNDEWSRGDIENEILEHSGRLVEFEAPTTFCIIVGDSTNWKKYDDNSDTDVVKLQWLLRIIQKGRYSPFEPEDILYASPLTRRSYMSYYDEMGDSYTQPAPSTSRRVEGFFSMCNDQYCNYEVLQVTKELKPLAKTDKYLGITAYFDKYDIINDHESAETSLNSALEAEFIYHGGAVTKELNKDTKFIVADTTNEARMEKLKYYIQRIDNPDVPIYGHPGEILDLIIQEAAAISATFKIYRPSGSPGISASYYSTAFPGDTD